MILCVLKWILYKEKAIFIQQQKSPFHLGYRPPSFYQIFINTSAQRQNGPLGRVIWFQYTLEMKTK